MNWQQNVEYANEQVWSKSNFFNDGRRKIDYVLVLNVNGSPGRIYMLYIYLKNLVKIGIQWEREIGITNRDLVFFKLHAPDAVLRKVARFYDVNLDLEVNSKLVGKRRHARSLARVFETQLTSASPSLYISSRAKHSLSAIATQQLVSRERACLMEEILKTTSITQSQKPQHRGFAKLIQKRILNNAYPLHDGEFAWDKEGLLNDRQLLNMYWCSMRYWFSEIPLNLIFKYFGPELAFYFAFNEYYIKMLIVPSIVGTLCFIMNCFLKDLIDTERYVDICNSTKVLCPICSIEANCYFNTLDYYCTAARFSYIFDNGWNIIFSIFMIFWSLYFINNWHTRENELKFRWNMFKAESEDFSFRPAFHERAKKWRSSSIAGEMELIPVTSLLALRYFMSVVCCFSLVIVTIITIYVGIVYRVLILTVLREYTGSSLLRTTMFQTISSALLTMNIIKLFGPVYSYIAIYLTDRENPRTWHEYQTSCTYKMYFLAFINNYLPIFYHAFIKGTTYTAPQREVTGIKIFDLNAEVCQPNGCAIALAINVFVTLCLKISYVSLISMVIKNLRRMCKWQKKSEAELYNLPQWEKDYMLQDCQEFFLIREYSQLAVQYGLVMCFCNVLPIAPAIVLIRNVIEVRLNARKFLTTHKRPRRLNRMPGIGPWNQIFSFVSFMSTTVSAAVIAFATDVTPRETYRMRFGSLQGYTDFLLIAFSTSNYPPHTFLYKQKGNLENCYYRTFADKVSNFYCEVFTFRLGLIVVIHHTIWFTKIIYSLWGAARLPRSIEEDYASEQLDLRNLREQIVNEASPKPSLRRSKPLIK